MINARLYIMQRLTALIMAPLVIGHIGVMIYAVQNGLSAEEILGRTQGSYFWAIFYGTFALAVAIHAAIGLRAILHEWVRLHGMGLNLVCWVIATGLAGLGLQAVYSVTG